ncbi:MAG: bifunctional 4-hydroxy-2-oxoglutarate aldolase/2-dehydro-3-deoxy-phosphogluconate aldolase [Pleomorphochaeta sp.]|jgi:2-dehydro-3-deoxyphosphogluconate aldolase/(4S)-4-hydroxy-2-oxoglutarate aldolase
MTEELKKKLHNIGIVPVVKLDDANKAVGLAKALLDGGINCAEVTFRTAAAEESIKNIVKVYPEMFVGAGTVTNVELAKKAVNAGAKFIVSPGFNEDTVGWCVANDIPIIPGVCTPSDIEKGLARGFDVLKFFPAEASGGINMLKNFAGPFPNLMFMPTGGINLTNLQDYAKTKNVLATGGSWMVKADLIENEKWDTITDMCKAAMLELQGFEFAHIGIEDDKDSEKTISALQLFGLDLKRGSSSSFVSNYIEVVPSLISAKKGHIGFKCNDIERAIEYLKDKGFTPKESSFKYNDNNQLKVCYFNEEVSGFALHLVRK